MATELAMELGHVFIEVKIHRSKAITIPTSDVLIQHEDALIPPMHRSMLEVVEVTIT